MTRPATPGEATGTEARPVSRRREVALLLCGAVVLAVLTVSASVRQVGGLSYLDTEQVIRHESVITSAGVFSLDPWAYRLLSELGVEALVQALRGLGWAHPERDAFVAFRFLQNVAIFALAYAYFRRLGLRRLLAALGLALLAWAMSRASFGSDLKFDTYGDVIFYLVAALIVLRGPEAWIWIVPLTALAAANRETSAAIPLLLAAVGLRSGAGTPLGRRALGIAATALVAFGAVYLAIRGIVGDRPPFVSYGMSPGFEILSYNVRLESLNRLFTTLLVLPVLCWLGWAHWPGELRAVALGLVPVWVVVHLLAALVEETRLFLVPAVLVFIPGTLLLLAAARAEPLRRAARSPA